MRIYNKIMKYSRSFSSKRTILAGIKKLEQLINNNIEIKDIVSNVEILLAAKNNVEGTDIKMDNNNKKSLEKLKKEIRTGSYIFKPLKIIKKENLLRSKGLGIPNPKDQIVLEAMRMVLEAVFAKEFLKTSLGFIGNNTPHTALNFIKMKFGEKKWFIEGKLSNSFDSFNHKLLIQKINQKIKDQVFIDLLYKCLKAGYLELGFIHYTKKGINPISSILTPILTNIYLHDLDLFVDNLKNNFDKGLVRKSNNIYQNILRDKSKTKIERLKYIHKNNISNRIPNDPSLKRLVYIRYGEEFLIGIIGSIKDSMEIRLKFIDFLKENLNLTLNLEEAKIKNASLKRANFLGYEIHITPIKKRPYIKKQVIRNGKKTTIVVLSSTRPLFSVPISYIKDILHDNGFTKNKKEGQYFKKYIHRSDEFILNIFSSIWIGISNYYSKATNFCALNSIYYILVYSCLLTLVYKHKLLTKRKGVLKYGMPMAIGNLKFPSWGVPILPKNYNVTLFDVKSFIEARANS